MTQATRISTPVNDARILMISYTSFIQRFYQTLPHEIAKQSSANLKVLVPPYWKEMWSDGKKLLEKTSDPFYDIVVGKTIFTGNLHFAIFAEKLSKLLREFKPHIIDIENETFNAGAAQLVFLRNRFSPESKVVLHASQHQFKRYPPPFSFFEKYVLNHSDAILVRNSMARDVLLQKGYTGRIEIVTHGVDTDAFVPSKESSHQQSNSKSIVGFVGALEEHKGVQDLIRAAAGLDCDLHLVGDGSAKADWENLAREVDVACHFFPPASHEKVVEHMQKMDIFVLPSRTRPNWVEKFGRVLIEAMACGLPIIGSDSGEIANVIGNAGIVFKEGNEADLRQKLSQLLQDPGLRTQLGQTGRKRAESTYSWQAIANNTLNIYSELMVSE